MLSGDFERKLRILNRNLRIFCGNDDKRAAGIFIVSRSGEYTEICGADKNYVPEFMEYSEDGHRIVRSGWRRILKILIGKGLVNRFKAEKVFGTHLMGVRAPTRPQIRQDSALQKLKSMGIELIETGSY
jgi:hypothetical protein